MTQRMHCLSLTQPWASLVMSGDKQWETRSWQTTYRGTLVIHASTRFPLWARTLADMIPWIHRETLPLGMALGTVELRACVPTESIREHLSEEELAFGDYGEGRFAWHLEDPHRFIQPITLRGHLYVFTALLDL